jgi:PAS domain S-box-containing protein
MGAMAQSGIKPHEELQELLPFERLLAEISTLFINLPANKIDSEIVAAQSRICEFLDLDRSALWITSEDDARTLLLTHIHQSPGLPSRPERMNAKDYWPWTAQKVLGGETLAISKMTELPAEAGRDRESYRLYGTKSTVLVPLSVGGRKVFGLLAFAVTREERDWPKTVVQQFELVAQIFANALSRKQAEKSLEERLKFEMLLTDILARFVNLPSDELDNAIRDAQRRICECLGLDLCALWQWSIEAPGLLTMTHIYRSLEGPLLPEPMDVKEYFPWCRQELEAGNIIAVSSMVELPAEAARDVKNFCYFGIKSCLVFPLSQGDGPPFGALGFNTMRAERTWPETIVKRLQLVTQIFTNALARKRAERELVKSEQRLRLITNALPVLIAYVDADQRYRFNNEAYREWFGVSPEEAMGRTIREVVGDGFFQRVRPYIERALSGEHVRCALDVEMAGGRPLSVEAIYVPDIDEQADVRGFYVLVIDVTDRNLAQQESKRLQDELLHAWRVSTMGELAGALAHEINQPLSAIMSNAQAARRYLNAPAPDMDEIKEIINDIVQEDTRAGEVIIRLRALLKKAKIEVEPVDLNSVFRETVGLLNSDAVIRDIKIDLELDPLLPFVRGDRIQLQQVALNLVLNAFDAMEERPRGERWVIIRTEMKDSQVLAAVKDNGMGVLRGDYEKVFQPFHTTKTQGLGMGLSISRSIINRHQGRIWVENNSDGGATFYFSLPASIDEQILS